MKTNIDDLAELINGILNNRENIYSLWGKTEDNEDIFLGIFLDEESARIASESVINSICKYHTALKHERKQI